MPIARPLGNDSKFEIADPIAMFGKNVKEDHTNCPQIGRRKYLQ